MVTYVDNTSSDNLSTDGTDHVGDHEVGGGGGVPADPAVASLTPDAENFILVVQMVVGVIVSLDSSSGGTIKVLSTSRGGKVGGVTSILGNLEL